MEECLQLWASGSKFKELDDPDASASAVPEPAPSTEPPPALAQGGEASAPAVDPGTQGAPVPGAFPTPVRGGGIAARASAARKRKASS